MSDHDKIAEVAAVVAAEIHLILGTLALDGNGWRSDFDEAFQQAFSAIADPTLRHELLQPPQPPLVRLLAVMIAFRLYWNLRRDLAHERPWAVALVNRFGLEGATQLVRAVRRTRRNVALLQHGLPAQAVSHFVALLGEGGQRRPTPSNLAPSKPRIRFHDSVDGMDSVSLEMKTVVELALPELMPPSPPDADVGQRPKAEVKVYYATDRAVAVADGVEDRYGHDRGQLRYGVAQVSVPVRHQRGKVERPVWWKLQFKPDPQRHFAILTLTERSEVNLLAEMRADVAATPGKQALLFVHGYNVTFADSICRTAQLAVDLDFAGVPMAYSWPSNGAVEAYTWDMNNADWSKLHLLHVLERLSADSGADTIHVLAHSMGNRVLAGAMEHFALHHAGQIPRFRQIVLAAPDIDADIFRTLATAFTANAANVTLYASSKDRALLASHAVNGYPRAGDTRDGVLVVPAVDTVDASTVETDFLGHSYYGDRPPVIEDIQATLDGAKPAQRPHLRPQQGLQGGYWEFA